MSLLQRIRAPFGEFHDDNSQEPQRRSHAVGRLLRERREELGWELAEIGEALRIRPSFLSALEQGRPQDLPGPTYAIGFVRAYAAFLGFDADRVLDTYKESADAHLRPDLSLPVPLPARSLPGGPILLVGVIVALCGYGTWYYLSTGDRDRPERVSVVPSELQQEMRGGAAAKPATSGAAQRPGAALLAPPDALLASAPAGPAPSPTGAPAPDPVPAPAVATAPAPAMPVRPNTAAGKQAALPNAAQPNASQPNIAPSAAPATVPAAPAAPVPAPGMSASAAPVSAASDAAPAAGGGAGVDIRAVADCWIQVRAADNQSIVFSRVLKAGETYHVPRPGLFLRTGNAGALAIVVDGKTVPAIGGLGALRRNVSLDPTALIAGTAVKG